MLSANASERQVSKRRIQGYGKIVTGLSLVVYVYSVSGGVGAPWCLSIFGTRTRRTSSRWNPAVGCIIAYATEIGL